MIATIALIVGYAVLGVVALILTAAGICIGISLWRDSALCAWRRRRRAMRQELLDFRHACETGDYLAARAEVERWSA